MKKILLIALFFLGQTVLGQEYHFDSFYEYKSTIGTRFFMVNSQDDSYAFIGNSNNVGLAGYLIDFKKKENHYYTVKNTPYGIDFEYYDSQNWVDKFKPHSEPEIQYDFSTQIIDSIHFKNIVIKNKVTPKGKKRLRGKAEFYFEKNEFVFHNNLMRYYANHFFDSRDVSYLGNRLPIKLILDYDQGTVLTFDLTKKEKTDTLLSLSKEQIKYRQ